MVCKGCGNQAAYRMKITADGESCNECSSLGGLALADVYFRQPYLDPHLIDTSKPEQKDGVFITSRSQKAAIMRHLGVREAGDKWGGARIFDKGYASRAREQTGGWLNDGSY